MLARYLAIVGIVLLAVLIGDTSSLAAGTRDRLAYHEPGSLFSNTVDWYTPPPAQLQSRARAILPSELFIWIPLSRRQAAIKLLGKNTIIELSEAQAAFLARPVDVRAIARSRIAEKTEKLRWVRDRAKADRAYKLMRLSDDEIRSKRRMDEATAQNLEAEIRQWQTWKGQLQPYLIRAVALEAGGGFNGVLIDKNLVVGHNAMGNGPLPMEKCPIVAYLPIKPKRIYTSVAITR